jgi:hypothetical protein
MMLDVQRGHLTIKEPPLMSKAVRKLAGMIACREIPDKACVQLVFPDYFEF